MVKAPGAATFVPDTGELSALARAAQGCRGCELFADATQAVFGAGHTGSALMLVGEQPGDSEDRAGEPFVGPAGRLLDQALDRAGIDRDLVYVTNTVKHFRFKSTEGSTRRIHATPSAGQVTACLPWLAAELRVIDPSVVVALGATAAKALLGNTFRVTEQRGQLLDRPAAGPWADLSPTAGPGRVLATIHPSAILRGDPAEREHGLAGLADDLRSPPAPPESGSRPPAPLVDARDRGRGPRSRAGPVRRRCGAATRSRLTCGRPCRAECGQEG